MKTKFQYLLKKTLFIMSLFLTFSQSYGLKYVKHANDIDINFFEKKWKESNVKFLQQSIEGVITDHNNTPLIGVSIIIKGTAKGTTTDFDGKFSINAKVGDVLLLSYLGFGDVNLIIDSRTFYDIKMNSSAEELEGVEIFSTGYQNVSKERATGSFSKIDTKVLERKIDQSIIGKIAGEAPGVQFDPFIQEKNNIGLVIRGRSSINATTEPLVVVDGFAIPGGFSTINPNDVETITILKDAAATSIWGIRAANGVIVITTKKGENNRKLSINLSLNSSVTLKQNVFKAPYADPNTQVDYQIGLFNFEQYSQSRNLFDGTLNEFSLFQTNSVRETLLRLQRGDIDIATADSRINALRNNDGREEYSKLFLRQRLWNQYNLSISGGGEKYNFNSSLVYNQNKGAIVKDKSDQFILNVIGNYKLTSKLKARFSSNISQTKNENGIGTGPVDYLINYPIFERILDDNGNYLPMQGGVNVESSQLAQRQGYPYPWTFNLKQESDNVDNTSTSTDIRIQTGLNYEVAKGLKIDLSYQYLWSSFFGRNLLNENRFTTRNLVNSFAQVDENGEVIETPVPAGSLLDISTRSTTDNTFRGQLNYSTSFKDGIHSIDAIAGYEVRKQITEFNRDRKFGYNDQSLIFTQPNFNTLYPSPIFGGQRLINSNSRLTFNENRFLSYYVNGAYNFNKRYTISGSMRLDDTNLFGASDEFRNIPLFSVGLKWNVTKENFFNSVFFNNLNVRATYGSGGNVDRNTSPFLVARQGRDQGSFLNNYLTISNPPNPTLRLEKTKTLNLGVDFSMAKNRIYGSVEYYNRTSEDLLARRNISPTYGLSSSFLNVAELYNKGVDIDLGLRIIDTKDFKFDTRILYSQNENKITSIDESNPGEIFLFTQYDANSFVVGDPIDNFYSFRYAGLDQQGNPSFFNENNDIIEVGGDIGAIEALKSEGSRSPTRTGSLTNTVTYKNLSLRVLTVYSGGNRFRFERNYDPRFFRTNVFSDYVSRWQQPGDELLTDVPRLSSPNETQTPLYLYLDESDRNTDDASYVRLAQVNLSYKFPQNLTKKLSMNSFTVSLQADNLKVWNFNKWDVDPVSRTIPIPPTFTLNLTTTF
ncbi:SusC/RagA family TonB-linked outer membrane protein [Algibacter pectinivorans]|uniref:TonB-linked outer membrane protein, SusC/RagA family n=1 Tax=Algibacter pectinivorans TaxID=870482 RepID=A0A1I1RKC9_9FLAO|nr:SusC/RagA family TonB-linked outer membrane protein [Algibacter pectinivorans]SFD34761.1 TonB-linked outer membrane protein, SusC/RagA family [Algibacter pectinivorans]